MKRNVLKCLAMILVLVMLVPMVFTGCGAKKEKIVIYTSVEDYVIEDMNKRLSEQFPDYNILVEYQSTGSHAGKLKNEGKNTECDITYDLEYAYMEQLAEAGVLADLSAYDTSKYMEDTVVSKNYLIQCRVGGAVILNTEVLKEKGKPEPTTYDDLLKDDYKGLISMANPKSSGTGYMFYKAMVDAKGEEDALEYFDKLAQNVQQFESSGSGPVNKLKLGEVAIGFGMTSQAVQEINAGQPLKVVYLDMPSPYTLYGMSMIAGKDERPAVKEVFDFLVNTYSYELNEKFFPEQMFKDKVVEKENYPKNIAYSEMKNNTIAEKERLLEKWKY